MDNKYEGLTVGIIGAEGARRTGLAYELLDLGVGRRLFVEPDDTGAARAGASGYGGEAFDTVGELLAEGPDAVVIESDLEMRAELATQALEAGAHVMLAAPSASSAASIEAARPLLATAGKQRKMLHHALPELVMLEQAIELVVNDGAVGAGRQLHLTWERHAPVERLLDEIAPQAIAIVQAFVPGSATATVRALGSDDDGELLAIDHGNVGIVVRTVHGRIPAAEAERVTLTLTGTEGVLTTYLPTSWALPGSSVDYRPEFLRTGGVGAPAIVRLKELLPYQTARAVMTARWLDSLLAGRSLLPGGGPFGLRLQATVEAAMASFAQGGAPVRPVAVK